VLDRLAALADEELGTAERERVTTHLHECVGCRDAWERYRFAAQALRRLAWVEAPPHILSDLERALDDCRPAAGWVSGWSVRPVYAVAAALLLVAAAALSALSVSWLAARPAPWDVVRLDAHGWRTARLTIGDWIETGAGATARMRIGEIGTVDVAPGTRVRLLEARPDEHRLQLAHGLISAEIVAPPRVFFVETPASTVVDLGCAYTMEVDEEGTGELRVTEGWASLEWHDRESLVPAGASAATRPDVGPGTPAFDDASERLREALLEIDFGPPDAVAAALDIVLAEARDRDTLTLWHLLSRVESVQRILVFERMSELAPLPAGVVREQALALDPDTLRVWREELAWTW
jgi:hypothetical protein